MKPIITLSRLSLALLFPALVQAEPQAALRWFNAELGESALMLINGQGFQAYRDLASLAPSQWRQPLAGDFNGDGETDLVWRQSQGSEVGVQLYQTGQLIWSDSILKASADWTLVGAADLNADGIDDLVWQNRNSGQLYAHQLKQGRVQAEADLPTLANANWQVLAVADFDADAKADLLFRHKTTNEVYVWLMDGFKLKTSLPLYPISPDWQVMAIGDLNADHHQDLIWQNSRDQETALMLQVAKAQATDDLRKADGSIFKVPTGWQVKAALDVDADGKSDLLWANAAGESALMCMDGNRIKRLQDLPQVTDKAWLPMSGFRLGQTSQDKASALVVEPSNAVNLNLGQNLKLAISGRYQSGKTETELVGLEISSSDPSSVAVAGNSITALSGSGATLTLKWQGLQTSLKVTVTAVKPTGVKITLKKPADWSSCYLYYWQTQPTISTVAWPGVAMQQDGNWCTFDFPLGTQSSKLIFSDKGANQTKDLNITGASCYDYTSATWTEACTAPKLKPAVTASTTGGSCYEALSVSLGVTGDNLNSGRYTISPGLTGTPAINGTSYNNGQKVELCPDSLALGQSQSLCLYATNGTVADDANQCYSFTKTKAPSPNDQHRDFRDETVYFMMTDRFVDGNPNNNNIWGDEYLPKGAAQMYEYNEDKSGVMSYYHGGDFDGIIKNLDYIKDMGFTAIWITPVVKQPEGRRYNAKDPYEASAFHGYWGYNFDQIDPHLHSSGKASDGWDDFDKLVAAVHAKGMKLMLDIVVNHGQPGDSVKGSKSKWADKWNQIIMDGKTWTFDKTTDPLVDPANPLTGFFSYPGTKGTWLIDLLDFNGNGPAANSAMPHLKNVYKRFIDHGVDAFRIDTVAYMSHDNWVDFTDEMYNHAKSRGNDYFYMIGEAWTGAREGANNALDIIYGISGKKAAHFNMLDLHNSSMDFPGWLGNVFKGGAGFEDGNLNKIFGTMGDLSGIYDPTYLGTFVDNHDVFRANGILNETQYKNNLNYIFLFRGVPIVYYGTEAMYAWDKVPTTTNKDDISARWMLGDEGINFVKSQQPTMYKHLKMLNALRRDSEVLRKGQQTNLVFTGTKAVIKRSLNGTNAYVGLSIGAAYSHTLTGLADGTYTKYSPDSSKGSFSKTSIQVTGGSATLDVPANSFVIIQQQ